MAKYMLEFLSHHQRNISFLLFTHDLENYIKYFFLLSNILTLERNNFISLHVPVQVHYDLFIHFTSITILVNMTEC